jgi:hypothetical protein
MIKMNKDIQNPEVRYALKVMEIWLLTLKMR